MIDVRTEAYPAKQIKVVCTDCNTTLATVEWGNYAEYQRKKANLKKWYTVCDKCAPPQEEAQKPKWVKKDNGDWKAECKNGDFLIWKFGRTYQWRWRKYGNQYADEIGRAFTAKEAKSICENYHEWIGKGVE